MPGVESGDARFSRPCLGEDFGDANGLVMVPIPDGEEITPNTFMSYAVANIERETNQGWNRLFRG